MIKRLFWASLGYVAGVGSSVWMQRRVRRAVERYTPEQVRRQVKQQFQEQVTERTRSLSEQARRTVIDLRDAALEGRDAMRRAERELRSEFGDVDPGRDRSDREDRRELDGPRHAGYRGGVGVADDRVPTPRIGGDGAHGSRRSGATRPRNS